jgi:predicted glycosyltransferase
MISATPESEPAVATPRQRDVGVLDRAKRSAGSATGKKIWIDLDNSPHVPFFLPIIEELQKRGHRVILTARDSYQVCELLDFHQISCKVIGTHWGKNRALKIFGTLLRAAQLLPFLLKDKPELAVSHGSRAQFLSSVLLGIPTLTIADYEFTAKVGFLRPDWVFLPQCIPDTFTPRARRQVLKYPGLKEDVYVPRFQPDAAAGRSQFGLDASDLVVTVRPPATEAHYHNPESEVLLDAALNLLVEKPDTRVILLPRNERQATALRKEWKKWIESRKILIPERVVDGLDLIWFSDLVISGGGTMNREAAALGVPVYSIFRGRIGGVDRYLADSGRLVLLETEQDVRTKIVLRRGNMAERKSISQNAALHSIVEGIISIAERRCLPAHR